MLSSRRADGRADGRVQKRVKSEGNVQSDGDHSMGRRTTMTWSRVDAMVRYQPPDHGAHELREGRRRGTRDARVY